MVPGVILGNWVRWFWMWNCQQHMMYMCCEKGNSTNIRGYSLFAYRGQKPWVRTRSVRNPRSASTRSGLVLLNKSFIYILTCVILVVPNCHDVAGLLLSFNLRLLPFSFYFYFSWSSKGTYMDLSIFFFWYLFGMIMLFIDDFIYISTSARRLLALRKLLLILYLYSGLR